MLVLYIVSILVCWRRVFNGPCRGGAPEQSLFCQHSVHLLENNRLLLFNNGRFPDRAWSTVDEFDLAPLEDGPVEALFV